MSDEAAIRRANLRSLRKTPKELQAIGGGAYSYWRDLMEDPKKSFGEKAARSIEEKLELPRGWLDTPQGAAPADGPVLVPAPAAAPTLAQALEVLGIELAKAPPELREALAANLAGWARAGGQAPWDGVVHGLLTAQAAPRKAGP